MAAVDRVLGRTAAARCAPLIGLCWAVSAQAAVEVEPTVSIGIAYTDNVFLEEEKKSETVYQASAGFALTQIGSRTSTDLDYRVEGYWYDSLGENEVYQTLTAAFRAALDRDNFFFDVGGNRDYSIRDPEAAIPRGRLPISGNRIARNDWYAGPAFQYPVGANATVAGSYRRTWTEYAEDEDVLFIRDFTSDRLDVSVDNYRKRRGVTWALAYASDETDYGVFEPWEYRRASVELGAWTGDDMRIFIAGGKESAWDDPFDPSLEDDFWEAGLAKDAGRAVSFEIAAGERTFGSSKRGAVELVLPRLQMSLRYLEQPTTRGRDAPGAFGPTDLASDELDDFLERPGAAERYLAKRLDWSAELRLRRTRLGLVVFDEQREERIALDGTPLDDEDQTGAYLTASWQAGARTDLQLRTERAERGIADTEQIISSVAFIAEHRLGRRTVVSFTAARNKESAKPSGSHADYTANTVAVLLTRTW